MESFIKPINIGQVKLANNIFMAPMAGITDKSFRQICREHGAGLTYSEMVSAKSIQFNNFKDLLDTSEGERPFAVQLFGRDPNILAEAAQRLDDLCGTTVDIVDINMGCPAPKIVKNGEGSALMKEPLLVGKIVAAVSRAAGLKPVTIKIRKGFTAGTVNAVEIAKIAQESGAAAVTVHGRTRDQFYSGQADWDAIAAVKAAVKIPVIANGDVFSRQAAEGIFQQTGCDGVMVARGALGNPWLFGQILRDEAELGWPAKKDAALRHLYMVIAHKGARNGALEMRKQLSWYVKGHANATEMRKLINRADTVRELELTFELVM